MIDDRFDVIKAFEHFSKYRVRKYDFEVRNARKNKITYLFRSASEAHMFYFVNNDGICHITQSVIDLSSEFKADWCDEKLYSVCKTFQARIDLTQPFWKKEVFNQTLDDDFLKAIKEHGNILTTVKETFYNNNGES